MSSFLLLSDLSLFQHRMFLSLRVVFFLSVLLPALALASGSGNEKISRLLPDGFELTEVLEQMAMPELYPSKLGLVMSRYYKALGGLENWSQIKSLKITGELIAANKGEPLSYVSISKKPNLLKMEIEAASSSSSEEGEEGGYALSFDGQNAWMKFFSEKSAIRLDSDDSKVRLLKQSAEFTSLLLFPFRSGKSFEYLGTTREENSVCHWIRVRTKSQFIVDYYIDAQYYKEVKVVLNDSLSSEGGLTIQYLDYKTIDGIPIAHKVITEKAGQEESRLIINSVEKNVGVLKWMFELNH